MSGKNASTSHCRRLARPVLVAALGALCAPALAGGIILYEVGSADVGLASAGYGARAQDASTVLTNPAGMTRLDGTQVLAAGQLLWGNVKFSVGSGTSPALGGGDGGYMVGRNGWFPGGGAFASYSVSPDLKLGMALTGNFGMPLNYDDDWVGRYYVQKATMLGLSFMPTVAYKVSDKVSVGAGLNAMYGIYKNQVAINNLNPSSATASSGWRTRPGAGAPTSACSSSPMRAPGSASCGIRRSTWTSTPRSNSRTWPPACRRYWATAGCSTRIGCGHQGAAGRDAERIHGDERPLGAAGQRRLAAMVEVRPDRARHRRRQQSGSVTKNLEFKDTWHVAAGAQYRYSDAWLINFGIAYDSKFQSGNVSPLLPANSAWRFGAGAQQQLGRNAFWGFATTMRTAARSTWPSTAGQSRSAAAATSSARTTTPGPSFSPRTTTGSSDLRAQAVAESPSWPDQHSR